MQSHQLIHTKWLHARRRAVRKVAPCTRPCSGCWWSCRCCPSKRWRRTTCRHERVRVIVVWAVKPSEELARSCNPSRNLHVHLGVVDEVLQRVSARVEVLQLCVVGDCADSGVEGSDHPADVDRLDVGEVGEDSSSRSTGGLREYLRGLIINYYYSFSSHERWHYFIQKQ